MSVSKSPFQRILLAGTGLLFPSSCHLCGLQLSVESRISLCLECQRSLAQSTANRCELCSAVVGPNLETSNGCVHCRKDAFSFQSVTSLGIYDGLLKSAVLQGKYGVNPALITSLTDLLHASWRERLSNISTNLIVPIPHHWTDRLLKVSQASTNIANRLSRLLKVPIDRHILRKRVRTKKQHALTPAARRKNLKSAFRIPDGVNLMGTKILLVDDVLTTGTTCQRATRLLLQSGADEVRVAVLARGIGA